MDSLKFHPGPPCSNFLFLGGRPLLKQPYGHFRGGPPAGQAACNPLLPPFTPLDTTIMSLTYFFRQEMKLLKVEPVDYVFVINNNQ
jgi:hypothetical protein